MPLDSGIPITFLRDKYLELNKDLCYDSFLFSAQTYCRESFFLRNMKFVQSKYRLNLTNKCLSKLICIFLTSYHPDFQKLPVTE